MWKMAKKIAHESSTSLRAPDEALESAELNDLSEPKSSSGWIGVDLDGTLAHFGNWEGIYKIGDPVPLMVDRVKEWVARGIEVRIVTARVGSGQSPLVIWMARIAIRNWCKQHLSVALPVTASKDFGMIELWDDRSVQVIPNTGERADLL